MEVYIRPFERRLHDDGTRVGIRGEKSTKREQSSMISPARQRWCIMIDSLMMMMMMDGCRRGRDVVLSYVHANNKNNNYQQDASRLVSLARM